MTQKEKEQKQLELRRELADLQTRLQMLEDERRALEATPVQKDFKVWEPEESQTIWDSGTIESTSYSEYLWHNIFEVGMFHPTKEAAEHHHAFLVMLHDLHKFAIEHNEGWKPVWGQESEYIYWDREYDNISRDETWANQETILPHFKPGLNLAQKAIETFGDRLKILFEYYNS